MSPIHHHFELIGWPETTVIIRFWMIAGIGVAVALGLFYADFARRIGVRVMAGRALVYGLAITGEATARALLARGWTVVVADDRAGTGGRRPRPPASASTCYEAPDAAALARLVGARRPGRAQPRRARAPSRSSPRGRSAGRAGAHRDRPGLRVGAGPPGGPRPMVAVTGTDGKTTTTLMATAMLEASGRRAVAAGNTELPLVAALDLDVDVFVVECTSFRLAYAEAFRAEAGDRG